MITPEKRLKAISTLLAPIGAAVDDLMEEKASVILVGTNLDQVDMERIHICLWGVNEKQIDWIINKKPVLG